jgi:hypothetical protein
LRFRDDEEAVPPDRHRLCVMRPSAAAVDQTPWP